MLADVRRRSEDRLSELSREYFQHHAGFKPDLAMAPIVGRYADLLEPEVRAGIREAWEAAADPELKQQLGYLYGDCMRNVLRRELAPSGDALGQAEARAVVSVGGKTISYPQASMAVAKAPTRDERKATALATRETTRELNTQRLALLQHEHQLIAELGFKDYRSFYEMVRGIDFAALAPIAEKFLADTVSLYKPLLATWADKAGLPVDALENHDVAFLRRAANFDEHFPGDKLVATLHQTLAELGLPAESLGNITMDLENRPGKSSRAFCMGVRIPQEIYLCITPNGGADDYQALFHEMGHALHFSHASAEMPFEFRFMGDNSVCEAFAFNMEHLCMEEGWLTGVLGLSTEVAREFRRYLYQLLLLDLRRFAAKHLFELRLHEAGPIASRGGVYADLLSSHLGIRYFEEDFLAATDGGFYTAQYFRAWCLEAQLKVVLKREFGADWFRNPKAGAFMQQLWANGQRLPGDALARHLGFDGISTDALLAEVTEALA